MNNRAVPQIVLSLLVVLTLSIGGLAANGGDVVREPFTVQFGDFAAQGELTFPKDSIGPLPAIVLVHGSGPADKDNTVTEFDFATGQMQFLSANFATIANTLANHGFAVVRYNKRYVNGADDLDYIRYSTEVDLGILKDDLTIVLDFARNHPLLDENALYLYGWSEGSTVAAQAAIDHPDVAGLILQTPVALSWRETMEFQTYQVGLPYLRTMVPDGIVTNETLWALLGADSGGMVAKGISSYIADGEAVQLGQIQVNRMIDFNADGQLSIDDEIVPGLDYLLDFAFSEYGYFSIYRTERALPTLLEQVGALRLPVLILQGVNDANTPEYGAVQLAEALEANGREVTMHLYDGLGHSLGPADSVFTDRFAPIDAAPLSDLVTWLEEQSH